jgi:5'-methylthioadenosine phosphorylase
LAKAAIGIIGGSGLYQMAGLEDAREVELATPFGPPSGPYRLGTLAGRRVAFLPRHGPGHRLSPSQINFQANVYGFKQLGVTRILSASAVGSMQEEVAPLDIVIPDQFIDRTRHRPDTFFEDGIVAHVSMADPVCPELCRICAAAAKDVPVRLHEGGIYLCIEGPQFSTRAESRLYRAWGVSVIGMTNLQEAKLAREAEICYVTLALVTDYDCWRDGGDVDVEEILSHLRQNADHAAAILRQAVSAVPAERSCKCGSALQDAILTHPDGIPEATRRRLDRIIGHRLPRP